MVTETTPNGWGKRYREARIAKGWTQRQLSDASGVRQAAISRVELGGGLATHNHVALAKALGLSLDDILGSAA